MTSDARDPDRADVTVPVPPMLCRRCVRLLSRHICDVPGVASLRIDRDAGLMSVRGDVDAAAVRAARDAAGFAVPAPQPGQRISGRPPGSR
jgi:copper chaperone CopZ